MQSRFSFLQAIVLFLSLFIINPLIAHEVRPTIVDIKLDSPTHYQLSIKLNLEALISQVDTSIDTGDSKLADLYDALREMQAQDLAEEFLLFEDNLLKNIQFKVDGKIQPLLVSSIDIPDVGDLELARDSVINIEGSLPANSKNLSWQWKPDFGNVALRVATKNNPELYSTYLKEGKSSDLINLQGVKQKKKTVTTKKVRNRGGVLLHN